MLEGIHDRCLGAYLGAAVGDAMGGPVENNHALRIRKHVGEIEGFLPYTVPTASEPKPGYALQTDAGSVTDDTFIRADFTRYLMETRAPRTPEQLADWLLANARFEYWWPPAIEPLRSIQRGESAAEECGMAATQGAGLGWWTPFAILHAGQPERAAEEARNLCRIWKAPLEQDLLAATVAGISEGLRDAASVDTMVESMLAQCRSLGRQLLERGIHLAEGARDREELIDLLYAHTLMPEFKRRHVDEPPRDADGPMPASIKPVYIDERGYMSSFFAEQVPLALSAFVFGKGDPVNSIPLACMIGRDADTVATTVGAWCGALHGESGLPAEWVETVCRVNLADVDIRDLAERLFSSLSLHR